MDASLKPAFSDNASTISCGVVIPFSTRTVTSLGSKSMLTCLTPGKASRAPRTRGGQPMGQNIPGTLRITVSRLLSDGSWDVTLGLFCRGARKAKIC